jgi:LPXTG-motif cell wall-anchored protein
MRTTVGTRMAARRGRRAVAAAIVALLVGAGTLLGATAAMAEAGKADKAEEIAPEKYPPPPKDEKTVPPSPPVERLVPTGVDLNWQWMAASGAILLAVGGALVLVRRRLSHD